MTRQSVDPRGRRNSERGTILLQVAIGGVVLLAFAMFVVDYGMLWVGRRMAQNAADAGALAGAVALALDNDDQSRSDGPAKTAAYRFATANMVLGETPVVNDPTTGDFTDVMFYKEAPAKFPPECKDAGCIRVDVHRDQARGKSIPSWFGGLVGVTDYGVRATATAWAGVGDTTDCLKPWAVIDKWDEHWDHVTDMPKDAEWTLDSHYDRYDDMGDPDPSITTPDVYIPPTKDSVGTGFYPYESDGKTFSKWYGLQLTLKAGSQKEIKEYDYGAGWFMALAIGDSTGKKDYKNNIKGCIGVDYTIGGELPLETEPGDAVGPTRQAVEQDDDSLIKKDPNAEWNPNLYGTGIGGVDKSAYAVSPRIVPVPLINPDALLDAAKNGRTTVTIANIMGFFIEGMTKDNKGVIGRLVNIPGLKASGTPTISPSSAWIKMIQLIR